MLLNIKKLHPNVPDLKPARPGDAGADLYAMSLIRDSEEFLEFGTGVAIELQEGTFGLIAARSSISNYNHDLANGIGVIDSSYRGEIRLRFRKLGLDLPEYKLGDKIGQLLVVTYHKFDTHTVPQLSETIRGTGGFGSSGA